MGTTFQRQRLRRAGLRAADPQTLYRPGGYASLGLRAVGVDFSERSSTLIARQLSDAMHARGNVYFNVRGLARVTPHLANELAHVFLSLSQHYPGVCIDQFVASGDMSDFSSDLVLAYAFATSDEVPNLHRAALITGESSRWAVLERVDELKLSDAQHRHLREEWRRLGAARVERDLLGHGTIALSECLTAHPRCLGSLVSYFEMRNARRERAGKAPGVPASKVSLTSGVLIHEFGHLVEAALIRLGEHEHRYVFDTIERALLRRDNGRSVFSSRDLSTHGLSREHVRLVNYPEYGDPNGYDGVVRYAQRRLVGGRIQEFLGKYPAESRREIFAEAFWMSWTSSDAELYERLVPLRHALIEVGLGTSRRHQRRGH